jgi:hypothetical protein
MAERQAFGANLIAGLDHDRRGIPYVRVRGIGENMTVRGSDADVAQLASPAIRIGDGVCRVSRHDRWSGIGGKIAQACGLNRPAQSGSSSLRVDRSSRMTSPPRLRR